MSWNQILFVYFPYVSIIVFLVGTIYRAVYRPFTISSLSSQLLEHRKLYWGSNSFHFGIVLILLAHLLALSLPRGLVLWNSVPVRLYLLEITGLALGLWALVGLVVLLWRRLGERRILKTSTPMDIFILLLLLVSVITGVLTATLYRYGSFWFTGVFTPYLMSLLILQPNPLLIAPLPFIIQLHAVNFFVLLAIFPFSRLVHIIAYPLGYLFRPWQIIVWERRQRSLKM